MSPWENATPAAYRRLISLKAGSDSFRCRDSRITARIWTRTSCPSGPFSGMDSRCSASSNHSVISSWLAKPPARSETRSPPGPDGSSVLPYQVPCAGFHELSLRRSFGHDAPSSRPSSRHLHRL